MNAPAPYAWLRYWIAYEATTKARDAHEAAWCDETRRRYSAALVRKGQALIAAVEAGPRWPGLPS